MKSGIHPEYGATLIRCACGNVIETNSTLKGNLQVEICSACHPFFTGKQKLIDTAGRIDRFKKKFGNRVALGSTKKLKKASLPMAKLKKASDEKEEPSKEDKA